MLWYSQGLLVRNYKRSFLLIFFAKKKFINYWSSYCQQLTTIGNEREKENKEISNDEFIQAIKHRENKLSWESSINQDIMGLTKDIQSPKGVK